MAGTKGFTLVEVLIALIVLAVGLLTLLGFLVHLGGLQEESTRRVLSAFCAQEKMEELKFQAAISTLHNQHAEEALDTQGRTLNRSWDVSWHEEMPGIREIEVECYYVCRGIKKGVALKSLIVP